ncbi:hypothetical protein PPL_08852 [Heterostelium album PN500]|uniref:Ankyrin repeat protein n=1 Tax=Heterostelium pallidum (strain ATCC 26659 / Pp 5 / PN500) TaxID=670386 RepID=D3BJX2_HETP5|nr:hypothetical protein PPL_08852 [Heterostelium album PN500]EFA78202.1 hypothetical protein PPL_08852 [Heterostelium album PN500]|eukprot:XP_020430328.1 hypothetical protein PPL_08852 [Heterostelium album PN500]
MLLYKYFIDILNNVVLRKLIFSSVRNINCLVSGEYVNSKQQQQQQQHNYNSVRWSSVLSSPAILISYGYRKELVLFLESYKDYQFTSIHLQCAVAYDQREILSFMLERDKKAFLKLTDREFEIAIRQHNLPMLKFLFDVVSTYYVNLTSIMIYACHYGSLETCKFLYHEGLKKIHGSLTLSESHMINAAEHGHLDIVRWLYEHGCPTNSEVLKRTVNKGHLDILIWIHENDQLAPSSFYAELMDTAATKGFLDIVKWIHLNRTEGCSVHAMDNACNNNHLEVVKWLHENRTEGCSVQAMDVSACNGNLEIVRWLHENRTEGCTSDALDGAAGNGQLETVAWLHQNRTEGCTGEAADNAIFNGFVDVADYLFRNHMVDLSTISFNIFDVAAPSGNLSLLELLHQVGYSQRPTSQAVDRAAQAGHLEVIRFIFEKYNVNGTSQATEAAALLGHLNVVKYLTEVMRTPSTWKALDNAAFNGHFDVVRYLKENRTEGCTVYAIDTASSGGHLDVIKYLMENSTVGFTNTAINSAAREGHLELFKYLLSFPSDLRPFDIFCLNYSVSNGHLPIVKHICENYFPEVASQLSFVFARAKQHGHHHIMKYFIENHGITDN